jgi:transposase
LYTAISLVYLYAMAVHSKLVNINMFIWELLLKNAEEAQKLAEELGLVPHQSTPPPIHCGKPMKVTKRPGRFKLGWIWPCAKKAHKVGQKGCNKTVNLANNTWFQNHKLPMHYCLAIMFAFVWKIPVNQLLVHLQNWDAERTISSTTVSDHYSFCREICEVIASHVEGQLGGPGLTIECDETFLTRRKYNRGRYTVSHTIVLFSVYCRETKEGLYFRTNGKSKRDLWPLLSKYIHPEIKRICTDQAKQYKKVKTLFSASTQHTVVNHSKGEFVDKKDKENHINSIENNNKQLKSFVKSR